MVVDTVRKREWINFTANIEDTGEYDGSIWIYFDESGGFKTFLCLMMDGQCDCEWRRIAYQTAIPKTAELLGKRQVLGITGQVWNNVSVQMTNKITATQDCVVGIIEQVTTNNNKIQGIPTGGSLTNLFDFEGISQTAADVILSLPTSCHPPSSTTSSKIVSHVEKKHKNFKIPFIH